MIVMVDFSLKQGLGFKKKEKNEIIRYGLYLEVISFVIAFLNTPKSRG